MNNNSTDLYSFYIDMYSCVHQKLLIHMYIYIYCHGVATTTCVLDHDVHALFGSSPPKKMQSQFANISDIMSKSFAARKAANKFFSDIIHVSVTFSYFEKNSQSCNYRKNQHLLQ
jgi:hypothetical protein